jgi:hypothetical protein
MFAKHAEQAPAVREHDGLKLTAAFCAADEHPDNRTLVEGLGITVGCLHLAHTIR